MEVKEASAKYSRTTGYKQTEVGVIPEDWEVICLGQLGAWKGGATPSMRDPAFWEKGNIPWVSSGDVKRPLLNDAPMKITSHAVKNSSTTLLPVHSILIVTRSGILRKYLPVAKNTVPLAINQDIKALIPNEAYVSDYLLQLLQWSGPYILASCMKAGTTVESVEFRWLKSFAIPLPPTKAEQEAIAKALSDADALIESLSLLLAKKRHLKQGAMQELLTGKKRLPGFSGEWEVKRLAEIAKIQRGASPRPIDSSIWFDENSSVGWVRISDVTSSGMYLNETTQRLSPLGVQNSRPVSRGSLIMSICATVGRPVITEIDVCIHDGFVVFENLRVAQHYLYYILKFIEADWSRHGQTGSQMNLNTGLINRTKVSLPPTTEEQTAIATILSDMDTEIAALNEKLAKARNIKQGIMHELLTGRIRLV